MSVNKEFGFSHKSGLLMAVSALPSEYGIGSFGKACFLCQHIGEKLGDNCITKYGKVASIKSACYRCADNYLQKQYTRHMATTISLDERIISEPVKTFDEEQENDYTVVDGLISKMKLTAAEYETLCAYMAGLTYLEVTRLLNVNRTTIWRRQNSIRKKYLLATSF